MGRRPGDDGVGVGHDSVGMMEGTVVVFAEPGMFKDVGLGERVSVEEEEMTEGLSGFKGEVRRSEGCRRDSGGEGHDDSRRIDRAFIPILLW